MMIRRVSLLISWGCLAALIVVPLASSYFLWNLASFESMVKHHIGLAIQWHTVASWQWYALWLATTLYLAIGWIGIYFLRRAFANIASGELFNLDNSRDLRRFGLLLFAQTAIQPLHVALSSVLLSVNHPVGERLLSISFGSSELKSIGVALILVVLSELLVEGSKLQTENRQFV